MARLCFTKETSTKFLAALKDGTIDINKMAKQTSEENIKMLSGVVGEENAKSANILFEKKLLLKNQEQGMIKWVESLVDQTPAQKRALINGIGKIEKLLGTEEGALIKRSLAEQKLGLGMSEDQFKVISDYSKKIVDQRQKLPTDLPDNDLNYLKQRMELGRSKYDLKEYVDGIKNSVTQLKLREYLSVKGVGKGVMDVAGLAKAMKASLDDSVILRQMAKLMYQSPKIWGKNAKESFGVWGKSFSGKNVMREIYAETSTRKNALNGTYDNWGIGGMADEAYPTSAPEKLPGIGRAFKASEDAFKGTLLKTRADLADMEINIVKAAGLDPMDAQVGKEWGSMIESITGRGNLGPIEKVGPVVNVLLFSGKLLKSHIDTMIAIPRYAISVAMKEGATNPIMAFSKKRAATRAAQTIAGMATVLVAAKAMNPDCTDLDPRSSDFGKIKVGNTRFDVTGGMGSVTTLVSRLMPSKDTEGKWGQYTKNSTSGKLTALNTGEVRGQTALDIFTNFATNKLSPIARTVYNVAMQRDFNNNPITLKGEASNLFTPLPVTTTLELMRDPNGANVLLGLIGDGLGISTNTYGSTKPRLQTFLGDKEVDIKIINEFDRLAKLGKQPAIGDVNNLKGPKNLKDQISEDKYNQFTKDFGVEYEKKLIQRIDSPFYKNQKVDDKKNTLEQDKMDVLDKLLRKYGYKEPKKIVETQK